MQTIGERLEEARKKKGISIREAAEATKIRGDYLQKFESNHFDIGLTEIYARGFLHNYATFLKLPAERILNDYAALGRGEVRPRQPSREIYGRMDISVASAGEPSDRAAPPEETAAPEPTPARAQPHYPRSSGASLPTGPDPAVVFQYMKIGGMVVLAIVVLWVGKSLFLSKPAAPAPAPAAAAPVSSTSAAPAADRTAVITALDVVVVQVWEVLPNVPPSESYGPVLLPQTTLARGESRTVPKNGAIYIRASAMQNIQIDSGGKRIVPSEYGHRGDKTITLTK